MRPWRRASSIWAAALSGSPGKRRAHRLDQRADARLIFADAVLERAQRRRVGIGERALHRDLDHLRREAVGVDAGDQHPRRIGLAQPQQQPGALGDPVDRIDVARRAAPWRAARRAARYAPSARRSACPSAASGSTGRCRSRRPTGRRRGRRRPGRGGRRPTGRAAPCRDIRPAAAAAARLEGRASSTALSSRRRRVAVAAVSAGPTTRALAERAPAMAGPAAAGQPAARAPGSASASAAPATSSGLMRIAPGRRAPRLRWSWSAAPSARSTGRRARR